MQVAISARPERFLIFELTATGPKLLESRPNVRLSVDNTNHLFDPQRFEPVFNVIKDCQTQGQV